MNELSVFRFVKLDLEFERIGISGKVQRWQIGRVERQSIECIFCQIIKRRRIVRNLRFLFANPNQSEEKIKKKKRKKFVFIFVVCFFFSFLVLPILYRSSVLVGTFDKEVVKPEAMW